MIRFGVGNPSGGGPATRPLGRRGRAHRCGFAPFDARAAGGAAPCAGEQVYGGDAASSAASCEVPTRPWQVTQPRDVRQGRRAPGSARGCGASRDPRRTDFRPQIGSKSSMPVESCGLHRRDWYCPELKGAPHGPPTAASSGPRLIQSRIPGKCRNPFKTPVLSKR